MTKSVILDLCGGTGAWSRPYREAGFDTRVVTLPEWDITKCRVRGAFLDIVSACGHVAAPVDCGDIYGVLAAPPCTEFSVAKGARPRDLAAGMAVVEAVMRIIWACQERGRPEFWALENPRGLLRRFLGKPAYTFEQWQFGGDKIKPADIWGYFNPPAPTVRTRPEGLAAAHPGRARDWNRIEYPPEYKDHIAQFHGNARRSSARAVTPAGFARAFFRANSRRLPA